MGMVTKREARIFSQLGETAYRRGYAATEVSE
jgi:hypothetical protein